MPPEKQLTESEARRFLELLAKVDADLERALSDVATQWAEGESLPYDFEAHWGASKSTTYTEATRRKYQQFVAHAYLDGCEDPRSELERRFGELEEADRGELHELDDSDE